MRTRLQQLRTFARLSFLIITIVVVSIILVGYGQGYIYDRDSGEITGGGLATFDSEPSNADIWLNQEYERRTPNRVRLPEGQHEVQLERDGYRSWSREFSLRESEVANMEYPVLIPERLVTTPHASLPEVIDTALTPDKRSIALSVQDPYWQLRTLQTEEPRNQQTIFSLAAAPQAITGISWSPGGSRLLVTTEQDEQSQHWLVAADGEEAPQNLSVDYELTFQQLIFTANPNRMLAVSDDEELLRLAVRDGDETRLAEDVRAIARDGNTVYAHRHQDDASQIITVDEDGETDVLIAYPQLRDLDMYVAADDRRSHVLVHDRDRDQLSLIAHQDGSQSETQTFPAGAASNVHISPNEQFIVMQSGRYLRTYDRQAERIHSFALSADPQAPLRWVSDYYLATVVDDELVGFDFDGANLEYMAQAQPGPVFANDDLSRIYSLQSTEEESSMQLQVTDLSNPSLPE